MCHEPFPGRKFQGWKSNELFLPCLLHGFLIWPNVAYIKHIRGDVSCTIFQGHLLNLNVKQTKKLSERGQNWGFLAFSGGRRDTW